MGTDIIECIECKTQISVELKQETEKVSCPECLVGMHVSKKGEDVKIEYAPGFGGIDGHVVKDGNYEDMSFGRYD